MPSNDPLRGAGPWTFETDRILSPGESYLWDFANLQYNGSKSWFRPYLPLDSLQVTNEDTGNPISGLINGQQDFRVVASGIDTLEDAGVVRLEITNEGSSDISAGDVIVEVAKDSYGADDRAREQAQQSQVARVVEQFTGIRL